MHPPSSPVVERIIGVYNAEGTLRGELAYVLGRLRGTAHCALCDITHGTLRPRAAWQACRDTLPVPFETYHLDDQPDRIRPLTAGRTPSVLADTASGPVVLIDADGLDACAASPEALIARIHAAVDALDLRWPSS